MSKKRPGAGEQVLGLDPLSSENGTYTTVKARFKAKIWPWLSGKSPWFPLRLQAGLSTLDPEELGGPVLGARALCISVLQRCTSMQSHIKTLIIYKLSWRKFTTQNDLY